MTEMVNATDRSPDSAASAASLMHHYGFDLGDDAIAPLLLAWQEQYPAAWIYLATIEALYQGRYKAISVAQILALWQRRSQPIYHFNHEFERLICDRLPQPLEAPAPAIQEKPFLTRSAQAMVAKLPSLKATPPHYSDAMQALRTLYEATDVPPADGAAESIEPLLMQTYSYRLRSDEPSFQRSTHEQSELLPQSNVDALLPSALRPLDSAVSVSAGSDETLQADLLALTNTRSDVELTRATDLSAITSSPVSNSAQTPPTTPQATSIARILQQLDNQEVIPETAFPGIGLLAQTLQPKQRLPLTGRYQPIWLSDPSSQPIHQFTPAPEASDFHSKLKLVAQVPDEVLDGKSRNLSLKGEGVEELRGGGVEG